MKTQISLFAALIALANAGLAVAQVAPQSSGAGASPAASDDPKSAEKTTATPTSTASTPLADRATTPPVASANGRRGFLMRLQLGGGYRSASSGVGATAVDVSGSGFGGSILVGGAVAPDLFLYGEFMQEIVNDPTLQLGQKSVVANRASMSLYGFGPGIAYMLPRAIHCGGTLLMTRMSIEKDDQELGSTNIGYGFAARLGKDFWLTDHHALGIVGQFAFASMVDKAPTTGTAPTFTATSFTLALSGTYN